MAELLALIKTTLAIPHLAPTTLPTTEGCFFGSMDYGEEYFADLKETDGVLSALLDEENKQGTLYYRASW